MMVTTTPDGHQNNKLTDTSTIPLSVDRSASGATARPKLKFADWLSDNLEEVRTQQLRDGYAWLCAAMIAAPDEVTLETEARSRTSYDPEMWLNQHGKRGGKEGSLQDSDISVR